MSFERSEDDRMRQRKNSMNGNGNCEGDYYYDVGSNNDNFVSNRNYKYGHFQGGHMRMERERGASSCDFSGMNNNNNNNATRINHRKRHRETSHDNNDNNNNNNGNHHHNHHHKMDRRVRHNYNNNNNNNNNNNHRMNNNNHRMNNNNNNNNMNINTMNTRDNWQNNNHNHNNNNNQRQPHHAYYHNNNNGGPPPPPPPPPPPLPINENYDLSSPNRNNCDNTNDYDHNHATNGRSSSLSSIIVLGNIPPSLSWKEIHQFFSRTYNVHVRFVKLLSVSTSSSPLSLSSPSLPLNVQVPPPPPPIDCKRAFVKFSTWNEASRLINYWKENDIQHLFIGGNAGNARNKNIMNNNGKNGSNTSHTSSNNGNESSPISVEIIGLHDSNVLPNSNAELQSQIQQKQNRDHKYNQHKSQDELDTIQTVPSGQWHKRNNNKSIKVSSSYHKQQQDQFLEEQKRKEQTMKHLQDKINTIQKQVTSLQQKKELLQKQESAVQKQIILMKKMVSIIKNDAKKKAEQMKNILSLTKKIHDLKKEFLGVVNELEVAEEEKKMLLAESEEFSSSVSAAGGASTAGYYHHHYHNHNRKYHHNHYRSSQPKQYSLDNRTKILRIEGFVLSSDEDGGENSSKKLLQDAKQHFESFGSIADVKWLKDGQVDGTNQGNNGGENQTLTLLVHCSTRGVAERIKNDGSNWNDMKLTLDWYQEPSDKGVMTGEEENTNNGDQIIDTGIEYKESGEDKNLGWTEDDDLMVDYDYDEDED